MDSKKKHKNRKKQQHFGTKFFETPNDPNQSENITMQRIRNKSNTETLDAFVYNQ